MFSLDGYKAVTSNGGVVRRADRGVLAVSGADRAAWLQGLLTNDVGALKDGEVVYSAYLTPQGRMTSDMHVTARGNRILLDVPVSLAATLRDKLDGLIFSEDAHVTDESARLTVWTVIRRDEFVTVIDESLPDEFAGLLEINLDTFISKADGTSITITASKTATGDDLTNVGAIKATNIALGTVTVDGDLGQIDCGRAKVPVGLQSLVVNSMFKSGASTQPATKSAAPGYRKSHRGQNNSMKRR